MRFTVFILRYDWPERVVMTATATANKLIWANVFRLATEVCSSAV